MEEIRPNHNLKIYIDNVICDPRESVSCPRAIIVSYNNVVITLKNHNLIGAAKLEVRFTTRTSTQKCIIDFHTINNSKKKNPGIWNLNWFCQASI